MLLNRKTKWDGTINLPYVLEIVHFENSLAFAITDTHIYRKVLSADLNAHPKILILWSPPHPRILIVHELSQVSWTKIMFHFTGDFLNFWSDNTSTKICSDLIIFRVGRPADCSFPNAQSTRSYCECPCMVRCTVFPHCDLGRAEARLCYGLHRTVPWKAFRLPHCSLEAHTQEAGTQEAGTQEAGDWLVRERHKFTEPSAGLVLGWMETLKLLLQGSTSQDCLPQSLTSFRAEEQHCWELPVLIIHGLESQGLLRSVYYTARLPKKRTGTSKDAHLQLSWCRLSLWF